MTVVNDIFKFLCEKFPFEAACDYDNPGLLVGDGTAPVKKTLVALDCTFDAIERAENFGAQLIITHHPVIWDGLKSVTVQSPVFRLIRSGISVISMHTNLDVAKGGVNDCLCERLGIKDVSVFAADDGFEIRQGVSPVKNPDKLAEHIKSCLGGGVKYVAGKGDVNRVLVCSGSGGEFIGDAIKHGFDALITADVKHDKFITAVNCGISLYDTGHFAGEDVITDRLHDILLSHFTDVEFTAFHPNDIKTV